MHKKTLKFLFFLRACMCDLYVLLICMYACHIVDLPIFMRSSFYSFICFCVCACVCLCLFLSKANGHVFFVVVVVDIFFD